MAKKDEGFMYPLYRAHITGGKNFHEQVICEVSSTEDRYPVLQKWIKQDITPASALQLCGHSTFGVKLGLLA